MSKTRLLALLFGILGVHMAAAQTVSPPEMISTSAQVKQTSAVLARFADIPVQINAPSLVAGKDGFTADWEMLDFLGTLKAGSSRMALLTIGKSQQGRDIPLVLFTAEGVQTLEAAAPFGRPVLWFVGQQHGNEPAGGEAMLAFAAYLASPEAAPLLSKVSVAIVPRANPDGAAAFLRATANKADLNRDHLLLLLPETRALHEGMAKLSPDVVFDHHEFSVANRWIEKFQAIQSVDAMVLHATNPMVPREISALAEELFRPSVEVALKAHGLSMFWYYTTSNLRSDKVVSMGGNNPGIARNALGLRGAVSFLIETRGVGIGREGWQRRVATHVIAAKAVIEAAAQHAVRLRNGIDAGRASMAAATDDLVIAAQIPPKPLVIPLMNPETAADMPIEVPFQDSRAFVSTQTRARAAGYFVTAGADSTIERLRTLGVKMCRLREARTLDVQAYRLDAVKLASDRETINPDQAIKATLVRRSMAFDAGALFVPMRQPGAGIIAATLEADTPGSYLSTGIIPLVPGATEGPVYALERNVPLPLVPLQPNDASLCKS